MNSRPFFRIFAVLTVLIAGFLLVTTAPAAKYKMAGEITAINLNHRTVVIEVPMDKKKFTVAGPLVKGARLTRNSQKARLSDFKVGEKVFVRWHSSDEGHKIDRITLR